MSVLKDNISYIASLSRSDETDNELLSNNLHVLRQKNNSYYLYPFEQSLSLEPSAKAMLDSLDEFDVVEFYNDNVFKVLFKVKSNDNALFVTNKCNSNCVMCPCSEYERKKKAPYDLNQLCEIVKHIPSDVRFLTITGGEPTIIGNDFFQLLDLMKNHFEGTRFFLLTNGRSFSNPNYTKGIVEHMPLRVRFAIPLYGDSPETHDSITQAKGSFEQTTRGIKELLKYNCDIEIRIVVSKLNYLNMSKIAAFIVKEFPGVDCVNIMATELMGSAALNRERVFIDYKLAFINSKSAIKMFLSNSIDVQLYNFPLCKVEKGYWPICAKSISDYKIRYGDNCSECEVRSLCGGVFNSTLRITNMELIPIKEGNL